MLDRRFTNAALGCACVSLFAAPAGSQQIQTTTDAKGNVQTIQTTTLTGPAATSAQIGAVTSAVPGSGLTPSTTPGTNAATAETALLDLAVTRIAAHYIVDQVCGTKVARCDRNKQVVLLDASNPTPDTSAWLTFLSRGNQFKDSLNSDRKTLGALSRSFESDAKHCGGVHVQDNFAFVPGAAVAVLAIAPKIASYFFTNYQISGVPVNPDDYLMQVSLVEVNPNWRIAGQLPYGDVPKAISSVTDGVENAVSNLSTAVNTAQTYEAYLADCKPHGKAEAAILSTSISSASSDIAAANAFLAATVGGATSSSAGGATASPGTLTPILSGFQITRALSKTPPQDGDDAEFKSGGGVLYLKEHSVAGGVIVKTNLATNLGAMPMYNSITMILSYIYYPPIARGETATGQAGTLAIVTPSLKANELPNLMLAYDRGACYPGSHPDPKAVSYYCPRIYGNGG